MKILFIAPLPPPISGQSLVSNTLYDSLTGQHEVTVVNMNKDSHADGINSFARIKEVVSFINLVRKNSSGVDCIYLQISESFGGNLKDLFFFLFSRTNISKMYIHLHGGTIKSNVYDKYKFLNLLNRHFISKMAGVLISGPSHIPTFSDKINANKIHQVFNYADDDLFLSHDTVVNKFKSADKIRILYMSAMIPMKGYLILLSAIKCMDESIRNNFIFDFAGSFNSIDDENYFKESISDLPCITYHGIVSGEQKKNLFHSAHALCLPTMYLEGQSVCVIEAYASGCIVITTGKGGLVDIFSDNVNGIKLEENSSDSIIQALMKIHNKFDHFCTLALSNLSHAHSEYTVAKHLEKIHNALTL